MTTYQKAVRFLLVDMVKAVGMRQGTVLTKQDAIDWFRDNFPAIDQKTVECHLTRLSVNAPSRIHYHAVPREDDVLFKIDSNHFRLYNPRTDPAPLWSVKQAPTIGSRRLKKKTRGYDPQFGKLLDNLDELHLEFYKNETFSGPSLYFHRKALQSGSAGHSFRQALEYIYATLASWGMHRMGKGGPKMLDFDPFMHSVTALKKRIEAAARSPIKT